jgi:hypothetical protein
LKNNPPSIKEPVSRYIALWCIALSGNMPQCSSLQLRTNTAQLMPQIPGQRQVLVIAKIAMQRISDK